jgi:hypothetical protein
MTLAPLQLPFDGRPDQVQPGFAFREGGVHPGHHLRGEREGQAFGPKFFSSHGSFSYVRY